MQDDLRLTFFEHLVDGANEEILKPFVEGKIVHDLGCGNFRHAPMLLNLGVERLIGIDRDPLDGFESFKKDNVEFYRKHFHEFTDPIDVAFVSWPVNWACGLHHLTRRADTVIYIGQNTGGSMCGYHELWEQFKGRPVLAHIPDRKETTIVYGSGYTDREALPEEHAALNLDTLWQYEQLMELFDKDDP